MEQPNIPSSCCSSSSTSLEKRGWKCCLELNGIKKIELGIAKPKKKKIELGIAPNPKTHTIPHKNHSLISIYLKS